MLTRFTDAAGITQPHVGQVQALMSQKPPWAVGTYAKRQSQVVQIAAVKWNEYAGCDLVVFDSPVYKRAFKADPQGNFWACELLDAILITTAPYLGSDLSPRSKCRKYVCSNGSQLGKLDDTAETVLCYGAPLGTLRFRSCHFQSIHHDSVVLNAQHGCSPNVVTITGCPL